MTECFAAAVRLMIADRKSQDPLPPGPNYGPFGYFRLGILIFAVIVAIVILANLF